MTAVKIMKRLCASNKIEECSISSAFQSVNEEEEDAIESNTIKETDLSTSAAMAYLPHEPPYKIDALILENVRHSVPLRFLPAGEAGPNLGHER